MELKVQKIILYLQQVHAMLLKKRQMKNISQYNRCSKCEQMQQDYLLPSEESSVQPEQACGRGADP